MKTLIIAIISLGTVASVFGQTRLEVSVENIRNLDGNIRVGLFASEDTFLKDAVEGKVVKVSGKAVTVVFENIKPGDYAISAIHDENANGDLDSNVFGMPKEGFAFGNNSMGMFGPPSFEKAKISVIPNKTVMHTLKLRYL